MYLVIAEKPSVSQAIAEVIGVSKRERRISERKGLYRQLVFWTSSGIYSARCL